MPAPRQGEKQVDFITRCTSELVSADNRAKAEAAAICRTIWSHRSLEGYLYQMSGAKGLMWLLVSLWSLRNHTRMPACICYTCCEDIMQLFANDDRLNCVVQPIRPLPRHGPTKTNTYLNTPYERTIYLDADTIVLKDLDCLFTDGLTFAKWGGRINKWGKQMINAGLVCYGPDRHLFEKIKKEIISYPYGDQRLLNKYYDEATTRIVDERWNVVNQRFDKVKERWMIHTGGARWGAAEYADYRDPILNDAIQMNVANCQQWIKKAR